MKISVITVCYNAAETIERTIQSVLGQTYHDIEYIIIDGGSTDGTVDVIRKYADKIAYWTSEPDKGIYDAMNKGIRVATGDVVGIINSDDWYEKGTFQTIADVYAQSDGRVVLHGDIAYHKGEKVTMFKPASDLSRFWYGSVIGHPTVFVPRILYKECGAFDTRYKIAADYDLLLRFYLRDVEYRYIPQTISHMSDGGVSSRNMIAGYAEVLEIAWKSGLPKYKILYAYCWKSFVAELVYLKDALKSRFTKK